MALSLTKRADVFLLAVPIIAANIASPLVGWVDTAVIGQIGDAADLAALALGTLIFNALYWSFGFLRMSATALTAQALGRDDEAALPLHLWRGMGIGFGVGVSFIVLSPLIMPLALMAFSTSPALNDLTSTYVFSRIWGAPAALAGMAVQGWLIGMGRTRMVFIIQLVLNLVNAAFSILFVRVFEGGLGGVAAASALAQIAALVVALYGVRDYLRLDLRALWARLIERAELRAYFGLNRDIFLRTLALLAGFYWFNEASLRAGTEVLAGNAILLQFITLAAMFLDAFAYLTESAVGGALGRGSRQDFLRMLYLMTEQAVGFALALSALFFLAGPEIIDFLAKDETARAAAKTYLPYCALVPLIGLASWQLDGVMIGATRGALMRNAMIAAFVLYLALDGLMRPLWGGHGLWLAFLGYYIARAGTLMLGWKGLMAQFQTPASTPTASSIDA